MIITIRTFFLSLLMLAFAITARAESVSPLQLVELTVDNVVADMNANQDHYETDFESLRAMVMSRVAPHFNFDRMTQLAMAKHWREASPEQRREISEQMLELMIRTYTNSMFRFRNAPVTLQSEKILNPRTAMVNLSVTTTNGEDVAVMLRMENRGEGWQVIDVVVGGVSMVITYRGTFAEEISKSGIDGLIASIRQENLERRE